MAQKMMFGFGIVLAVLSLVVLVSAWITTGVDNANAQKRADYERATQQRLIEQGLPTVHLPPVPDPKLSDILVAMVVPAVATLLIGSLLCVISFRSARSAGEQPRNGDSEPPHPLDG